MDMRLQRILFAGTSRLTDVFPVFGRQLLNAAARTVYSNHALSAVLERGNRKTLKGMEAFTRFLVIPDIHIGDAVMTQPALTALRDFFPNAAIDYVVNRTVASLIEGNPEATRIQPVFSDGQFASSAEIASLREIIRNGRYDLCISFSPFLNRSDLLEPGQLFLDFMSRGPAIVRNESNPGQINHFSYQAYRFVRDLFSQVTRPVRGDTYRGVQTSHSDESIRRARDFVQEAAFPPRSRLIMVNPDSGSRFNLVPFEHQAALLELIARNTGEDVAILLGAGHTEKDIGKRLYDFVPASVRSRIRIIPRSMPLEAFSALIDFADVFVTGDTGPMHLAAARRFSRSGSYQFRNRTAVLSIFGATPSRMSGYDAFRPGYLPANQDAPSWSYQAGSPCRNITCLNKMFKTCRTVRCFEEVDVGSLATRVTSYLGHLATTGSAPRVSGL
jgi:ADP-heptose:LPS heptosyltransferase